MCCVNTYSFNVSKVKDYFKEPFVATLSAGPMLQQPGKTQTLDLTSVMTRTYTADKLTRIVSAADLFLGIQKPLAPKLVGHIGLEMAATSSTKLTGDVWEDANPAFNNYFYKYEISHKHIALQGKLLGDVDWQIKPWLSATAGIGFNKSHSFINTPSIFAAVASPNFADKTISSFTYGLGLGAQYILDKNWQIGLGYEFSDWGKSKLGSMSGADTNQKLSLSKLHAHSILVNLTFIA